MANERFIQLCKEMIRDYFKSHVDATVGKQITADDVYVVWFNKALQNNKPMTSTTVADGMYYGDENELYLDVYKKWENVCIKL